MSAVTERIHLASQSTTVDVCAKVLHGHSVRINIKKNNTLYIGFNYLL